MVAAAPGGAGDGIWPRHVGVSPAESPLTATGTGCEADAGGGYVGAPAPTHVRGGGGGEVRVADLWEEVEGEASAASVAATGYGARTGRRQRRGLRSRAPPRRWGRGARGGGFRRGGRGGGSLRRRRRRQWGGGQGESG